MVQTRTARWTAGAVLLCVALLAASWFLLVSPRRDEAADLRTQDLTVQSQNAALQAKIEQLKAEYATLPRSKSELAAILAQMPTTAQLPRLVRDLDAMAKSAGVILGEVTPGDPEYLSALTGSGATPATASGATATATSDLANLGTAGTSGTTGTSGTAGTSGAAGRSGAADIGQVVAIPVSVIVDGDYFQAVAFLDKLQTSMTRAFLVTGMQVVPSDEVVATVGQPTGAVKLTITGRVFALPKATATAGGTTATGSSEDS